MVSAVAPEARILLIGADRPLAEDLGAAVDQAVALGAGYVSNSYGPNYLFYPEDPAETAADAHYDHPGVAIVASSGDTRQPCSSASTSPAPACSGPSTTWRSTNAS
ncbi:hypothetical protein [Streptomyces shenzhenensis]|uniref:hypothetical protein n=1 Tax=Streptomyces shenzhenensis TaxID=943815 RepID=UPI001F3D4F84|nr:hypothetical protein [Streptomyces shenzhenensis]